MESINRGVEVRRIHIVYFLCRNGAIEQPHLVRVHHLHYRGVHLRDVKRWLSELRGHDMPDSFAWSYKRRYRGCCVWQDLSDDDLITPISDNEYVLKGSLLPSLSKTMDPFFASEEKKQVEEEEEATKTAPETLQMDGSISPKPPPQSDESSPPRPPQLQPLGSEEKDRAAKSRFFSMGSWKRETKGNEFISNGENVRSGAGSHRQAATSVIRKLIGGCMAVETKDSEIRIVQRQDTMSRAMQQAVRE